MSKQPFDLEEIARRTKVLRQRPSPIQGAPTAPAYLVRGGRRTPLAIVAVTRIVEKPCSQSSSE